jgi:hypothetical protein
MQVNLKLMVDIKPFMAMMEMRQMDGLSGILQAF